MFISTHAAPQNRKQTRNRSKLAAVASTVVLSLVLTSAANAALVFYSDRGAFEAASGLSGIHEDFEEANVAPFGVVATTDPLNAATNDGVFSTGDIVAGLALASSSGTGVVALGAGLVSPTKAVAANFFADSNILSFSPGVEAIGLDLFSNFGNDTLDINIFGVGNALLGSTSIGGVGVNTPTFFGVISDMGVIESLDINSQQGSGEVIDNVTFGDVSQVPVPAPLALMGLGLLAMGMRMRR